MARRPKKNAPQLGLELQPGDVVHNVVHNAAAPPPPATPPPPDPPPAPVIPIEPDPPPSGARVVVPIRPTGTAGVVVPIAAIATADPSMDDHVRAALVALRDNPALDPERMPVTHRGMAVLTGFIEALKRDLIVPTCRGRYRITDMGMSMVRHVRLVHFIENEPVPVALRAVPSPAPPSPPKPPDRPAPPRAPSPPRSITTARTAKPPPAAPPATSPKPKASAIPKASQAVRDLAARIAGSPSQLADDVLSYGELLDAIRHELVERKDGGKEHPLGRYPLTAKGRLLAGDVGADKKPARERLPRPRPRPVPHVTPPTVPESPMFVAMARRVAETKSGRAEDALGPAELREAVRARIVIRKTDHHVLTTLGKQMAARAQIDRAAKRAEASLLAPGAFVTKGGNAVCHRVSRFEGMTICGKPLAGMTSALGSPQNFGGECKLCERMKDSETA